MRLTRSKIKEKFCTKCYKTYNEIFLWKITPTLGPIIFVYSNYLVIIIEICAYVRMKKKPDNLTLSSLTVHIVNVI